jgi:hypothetical protein
MLCTFSFRFAVLPCSTYTGVEVVLFSPEHTQTHTAVGRTPLDEGSARRTGIGLYISTRTKTTHALPLLLFFGMFLSRTSCRTPAILSNALIDLPLKHEFRYISSN